MVGRARAYLPVVLLGVSAVLVGLGLTAGLRAQGGDGDKFEGALWRFVMEPVGRGEARRGSFRVSGKELFQKDSPSDKELDRLMGHKEYLGNNRTRLTFDNLRANRGKVRGIKGRVIIEFDSGGEWSGKMVDGDGKHWRFKCMRFQE